MTALSILIPSRTRPRQAEFLADALASIRAQTILGSLCVEVLIGLDRHAPRPDVSVADLALRWIESSGHSQATALNHAARAMRGDYLFILEDDDRWHAAFLEAMLGALAGSGAGFVSSNSLVVDEEGHAKRIADFPTPSSWCMPVATWRAVGEFDETFRWHLDCEWLGRLGRSGIRRVLLVERAAPSGMREADERGLLKLVSRKNGSLLSVLRHDAPEPLVRKRWHPGSGMAHINRDADARRESREELRRLVAIYGRIPC